MLAFILLFFGVSRCSSEIIYRLNETEYSKMPALFSLDEYDSCLLEPGGMYCVVDASLYSETRSHLMDIIHGYSAHKMKHYNHTQIHRGVCVSRTCKQFLYDISNETMDLNATLEACLNYTLFNDYELNVKLENIHYCKRKFDVVTLDTYDIIVAVVYLVIIVLNVVGSLYDVIMFKKEDKTGNPYVLAFSLRRNWYKLVAPVSNQDPRLERLKLFHGLKAMTMVCVFFSHSVLLMAFAYVDNPHYIEKAYEDPLKQLLFNGSLVTYTFFVMSSFLLSYNFELHAEKHSTNWMMLPKGVLMRWLRLTPTYALTLATISTFVRHVGSGPLWDLVVTSESHACRTYWWAHVLYINNYIYDDYACAPETWYLAADTQLFVVGLLICVVARRPKSRVIALVVLFIISLITPAVHTYWFDLEAVVIQSPETFRSLYASEPVFRTVYIQGHTNLSTYTLGLAGGFLTYYWQNTNKNFERYKSYRWLYWLLVPLGIAVILSGGLFYSDGPRASMPLRLLYAMLYKPAFQLLIVAFIIGVIFKIETVYRGIVEWRGFTWTGRVSYSAFLLHTMFQRSFVGAYPNPVHISDYFAMMFLSGTIFITFACAGALWLCVESPVANVVKAVMSPGPRARAKDDGGEEGSKV